jgi:hypothetical protein
MLYRFNRQIVIAQGAQRHAAPSKLPRADFMNIVSQENVKRYRSSACSIKVSGKVGVKGVTEKFTCITILTKMVQ